MRNITRLSLLVLAAFTCSAVDCKKQTEDCESWCAGITAACPDEDTKESCEGSCVIYSPGIDAGHMACADNATSCDEVHVCWNELLDVSDSGSD